MVVDGRFIGCSLVCLLAFGLGLLASDPKCFEQSADKTDLKGNCMGSEVLVVKTQELKVTLKSTSLPKEVERFILTIGGCKIEGLYGPFGTHALIRREGHDYDLPLELTIMPGKFVAKNAKFKHEFDCSSTFEQNGNMYTIKVDYSADEAEKLDSLTATFDATVFVADEKSNTKEIITWIAIGLVVLIVIAAILIIIILCCFMKQKHDLVENDESYSQKSDRKKKPKKEDQEIEEVEGLSVGDQHSTQK
ncbi:hypothetical protein M3Y94_01012900 [Aphelenchoides besseyi]|nr:hypothetical protein M3Y94_01012900 [Aphelenchoides besseyi]